MISTFPGERAEIKISCEAIANYGCWVRDNRVQLLLVGFIYNLSR